MTKDTRTWEKWVRTLSLSYNPRDIDLLVAKIGILLDQARKEEKEKCIKLSDEIEAMHDTTFEEWRAFKHFRNNLRQP